MPDDLEQAAIDTDVVVLFGATGDLAAKKIFPAIAYARAPGPPRTCRSSAWRPRSGPTTSCGPRAEESVAEAGGLDAVVAGRCATASAT